MADQSDTHEYIYESLTLHCRMANWQGIQTFDPLDGTHLIIFITTKMWWEMESRLRGHAQFIKSFLKIIYQTCSLSERQTITDNWNLKIFCKSWRGWAPSAWAMTVCWELSSFSSAMTVRWETSSFLKWIFPIFPTHPENTQPCNQAIKLSWSFISYTWIFKFWNWIWLRNESGPKWVGAPDL